MKFLALQTDIHALRKQFIPEGEHEIMTVAKHPIVFFAAFIWYTILFIIMSSLRLVTFFYVSDATGLMIIDVLSVIVFLLYLYQLIKAYVAWRYNFLIITSDKIVIVEHQSFLRQDVNTVHLENIKRSHAESQFFGIFRCGIVEIRLDEQIGATAQVILLRYIPAADTVVSAIENAIALRLQITKGQDTPMQTEQKADVIKETLQEQVADAATEVIVPEKPTNEAS